MWIILLIVLAGCSTPQAVEQKPYGFWEAYAPYEKTRPTCTNDCPFVPVIGPSVPMPPSEPLYDSLPPSTPLTMLRTPSGALYHRYGSLVVDPDGGITTVY